MIFNLALPGDISRESRQRESEETHSLCSFWKIMSVNMDPLPFTSPPPGDEIHSHGKLASSRGELKCRVVKLLTPGKADSGT